MNNKEKMINYVIGLNPTGTISYQGTYQFDGNNNITVNKDSASKNNLKKAQSNSIICENFENYNNYIIKKKKFNKNNKFLVLFFLFIIIYFILILI
jgi:hypothetical protein